MSEKFYVAADFLRKPAALAVAETLEAAGMQCTARWIRTQPVTKEGGLGGELGGDESATAAIVADEDLEDIAAAPVFVQLTTGEKCRGGRQVELGFAIALARGDRSRTVISVGPRETAFHYHHSVLALESVADLLDWARTRKAGAVL